MAAVLVSSAVQSDNPFLSHVEKPPFLNPTSNYPNITEIDPIWQGNSSWIFLNASLNYSIKTYEMWNTVWSAMNHSTFNKTYEDHTNLVNEHIDWTTATQNFETSGSLTIGERIYHLNDADTFFDFDDDGFNIVVGNLWMITGIEGDASRLMINGDWMDLDFIVYDDAGGELINCDAELQRVGMGTPNPSEKLDVIGNVKATSFLGDGFQLKNIETYNSSYQTHINLVNEHIDWTRATQNFLTAGTGQFLNDFNVEGRGLSNVFYVNTFTDRVGVLTNQPTQEFNVIGDFNVTGEIINDAIYIRASDLVDQEYSIANSPQIINLTTVDESNGISTATEKGTNIIISVNGVYSIIAQPQVTAGAGAGVFHMWLQRKTELNKAFVDVPNSNIELSLASLEEDVIPLIATLKLNVNDKVRLVSSVSDTRIKLDAQTPSGEPAIPSIIFTMYRIGS